VTGLEHWEISGGGYRAVVLEAGGGLGDVFHHDRRIVRGSKPSGAVSAGRGQVLAPWPNRIRDGRYDFAGVSYQLALSDPTHSHAIHGLLRWCAWRLDERAPDRVTVSCRLAPQAGYPWPLHLRAEYAVDADGLAVTLHASNPGDERVPVAIGMHPYLDAGVPLDEATLLLPASARHRADGRLIPTGTEAVAGQNDFRVARPMAGITLDDGFTGLERDDAGIATVELSGAHTVRLEVDPSWPHLQVFTGDELPADPRMSLAVEPMSAPANAFNSGIDLVTLAPGEEWSGSFRISAR